MAVKRLCTWSLSVTMTQLPCFHILLHFNSQATFLQGEKYKVDGGVGVGGLIRKYTHAEWLVGGG